MASYQCPDCGQVIPAMGLDGGMPPACPFCRGAVRAGEPPVRPAANPAAVQPGPPPVEVMPPAPRPEDLPDDLDIRRKDMRLPHASPLAGRPARSGGWRFGWIAVVLGIMVVRFFTGLASHRPPPMPPPPQFHIPIPPVPMPPIVPPPLQPEVLLQATNWEHTVSGIDPPPRLIASGPDHPRVGLLLRDPFRPAHSLLVFDGATGAPAGKLHWLAPTELADASLSTDGTAVAVLVHDRGRATAGRFSLHKLPDGEQTLKGWQPYPGAPGAPGAPEDVWFSLVAPDRLLTVYRQEKLALWALPERRRLYSVELQAPGQRGRGVVVVSPDRRTVAVADAGDGFAFYDTATGAERGRTAPVKRVEVGGPVGAAFSPDGKEFAAVLGQAAPGVALQGLWVRWSCPDGAVLGSWPVRGPRDFLYWDAGHVLLGASPMVARRPLHDVRTGQLVATVDLGEAAAPVVGDGRRLWYVSTERVQPLPQRHLAALTLRPDWFGPPGPPGPPGVLLAPPSDWLLTPNGLIRRGR